MCKIAKTHNCVNPVCRISKKTGEPLLAGAPRTTYVKDKFTKQKILGANGKPQQLGMGVGNKSQGRRYWGISVRSKLQGKLPEDVIDIESVSAQLVKLETEYLSVSIELVTTKPRMFRATVVGTNAGVVSSTIIVVRFREFDINILFIFQEDFPFFPGSYVNLL